MKKNKTNEFTSEYAFDKATFKEFQMGFSQDKMDIIFVVGIICLLICLMAKDYNTVIWYSIFFMVYILFLYLIKLYSSKLQYNRFLLVTKGKNKTNVTIDENEIKGVNEIGNENSYLFDQIIGIIETKNLIILKLKYRLGIIINKNTLNTSKEELIEFLLSKCINLKKKKVKRTTNSINQMIIGYTVLIVILFLALLLK